MTNPNPTNRRKFRFSLRTLMAVMVLLSVALGWFGWKLREAERQRRAVEAIREAGGHVWYDYDVDVIGTADSSAPAWLTKLLGEDFFSDVAIVNLSTEVVGDEMLHDHLKGLTKLESLSLVSTQVTDGGIAHLVGATHLRNLTVYDTPLTDGGIAHLVGLTKLERLDLSGTQVTDSGIRHLKGLASLQVLVLRDTLVTVEGIKEVRKALPNCYIQY